MDYSGVPRYYASVIKPVPTNTILLIAGGGDGGLAAIELLGQTPPHDYPWLNTGGI